MADGVEVTVADLMRKVGMLVMECEGRARREDEMKARIAALEARLDKKVKPSPIT